MSRDDPAVRAPTETSPLLSEVLTHVPVTTSAGGPLPEPRNFDTAATDSDDSSDLLDDDEDLDKPRIPGARIELVLPALCVGVSASSEPTETSAILTNTLRSSSPQWTIL